MTKRFFRWHVARALDLADRLLRMSLLPRKGGSWYDADPLQHVH